MDAEGFKFGEVLGTGCTEGLAVLFAGGGGRFSTYTIIPTGGLEVM